MQLTKRDNHILEIVRDYGLVSTEHIRFLLFPSFGRTRKRLRQLWQNGLLIRIERPTRLGEGSKAKLYRISRRGSPLVDKTTSGSGSVPRFKSISAVFAEHQLGINRFRACVQLSVNKTPGIMLVNWISDRGIKFRTSASTGLSRRSEILIPDATFTLWSGNRSFGYFLELDRGTTPLKRIRSKLLGYYELFLNPNGQVVRPHTGFRVLFAVNSTARLNGILGAIQALPPQVRRPDIFLLARFDQFSYEVPEAVLGPIWTKVQGDRTVSPDQPLFPTSRRSRSHQVNHQCANQKPELAKGDHGPDG